MKPFHETQQYKDNTTDSTAELCLYFNLAQKRIEDLLFTYEQNKIELEYFNDLPVEKLSEPQFSNETYLNLKTYLWKEHVSAQYTQIKEQDIYRVNSMLQKLIHLRNYHSHLYHDSSVLLFPDHLVEFINLQHETVKQKVAVRNPLFVEYYSDLENDIKEFKDKKGNIKTDTYQHFDFFRYDGAIREEGKNFFLSFFLVKGEMERFLKKRKRCKRDNGERYQVKTKLLTELCHRDASSRFFTRGKESYNEGNEPLRRQFNTILNYLLSKPVADRKENPAEPSEEPVVYVRRSTKFADIAIRYFMDMPLLGCNITDPIHWEVKTFAHTEIEKQQSSHISTEENKKYMESAKAWNSNFEQNCFPYIKNNHIRFKLDGIATPLIINIRELKNWLYYLLSQKKDAYATTIQLIKSYAKQYGRAMDELCASNTISFGSYPLVFPDGGTNTNILSDAHRKILNQESFSADVYRQKILSRIDTTLEFLKDSKEQKEDLSRNRKNRAIIKCLNWYLPQSAKLKPDEVNMLSVYNFVAENEGLSNASRDNIIQPMVHKLKQATEQAYNCLTSANSLDDLFDTMLDKKCLSLQQLQPKVAQMDTAQLHQLAGKLSIRMLGADASRNGKDRLEELKSTIRTNSILVPNGFFKRTIDPTGKLQVSTLVQKRSDWLNLLPVGHHTLPEQDEFINAPESTSPIRTEVLETVEDNFQELHQEYSQTASKLKQEATKKGIEAPKTFKLFIESFTGKLPGAQYKEIKQAVDLYKQLKEIQVQDALLGQILFKYHNLDLPMKEREQKSCNITTLHQHEYTIQLADRKITIPYKQLDDLATHWDRKKLTALFQNKSYWNWQLKQELEQKGIEGDVRHINYIMASLYNDSFHYIDIILKAEEKIIRTLDEDAINQMLANSMQSGKARLPARPLFDTTGLKGKPKNKYLDLRNSAFHTNVPEKNLKYEDEKVRLADTFGITLPEKKDKNEYKR